MGASAQVMVGQRGNFEAQIAALFAAGEKGAWFDPSDQSTLFQDANGINPVTAVEQTVGLILDKSQRLVRGAEMGLDPGFNDASKWFVATGWSVSGGVGIATGVLNGVLIQYPVAQRPTLAAGVYYEATWDIVSCSAGAFAFTGAGAVIVSFTLPGTYRCVVLGTGVVASIAIRAVGTTTGTIDNFSLKPLAGNHATQATVASMPKWSAKVNLLVNSQWNGGGTTPTGYTGGGAGLAAPNGTIGSDVIYRQTAVASRPFIGAPTLTIPALSKFTLSVYVGTIYSGAASIGEVVRIVAGPAGSTVAYFVDGVSVLSSASISANTRITCVHTASTTAGTGAVRIGLGVLTAVTCDADFYRPQLETGTSASRYQSNATATSYDGVGFPRYLAFDGVDDSLATPAIDMTATGAATVWAGVRKLSDTVRAILVEFGTSYANVGTFGISAPGSNVSATYTPSLPAPGGFTDDRHCSTFTAPITNVISVGFDYGASTPATKILPRINGAIPTASAGTPANTGNFGNLPLYIGRRAGTNLPLNGNVYGLIVRGAASSAAQVVVGEAWLNARCYG